MEISESRKKFNDHYPLWEKSGLSRMEYCKREGFAYSWFMSHQKTMRRGSSPKGFEQIKPVISEKKLSSAVEFHYPDGRYFVFSSGTCLSFIKELIK